VRSSTASSTSTPAGEGSAAAVGAELDGELDQRHDAGELGPGGDRAELELLGVVDSGELDRGNRDVCPRVVLVVPYPWTAREAVGRKVAQCWAK
jgi:hypothetical protein